MIGQIVSHYKITEKLGAGGMGEVYKAEDTRLQRTVALKFLPPDLSSDQQAKKRFIQEARAASALDHPNICTIYEIGESDDDSSFIAMACYDGLSLREKIKDERLKTEDTIGIVIQIAKGLARAHEEGIVHRDIKPANIMITSRDEVKILDFGLAKLAGQSRLTKSGATVGTIAYMSPEQLSGKQTDKRSDIWSLGVVLYEMITEKLPFPGEYEQAIMYSILNDNPESVIQIRSEIPTAIEQVVFRALEKDPDKRYQDMEELIDDLKSITEGIVPEEIKTRLKKAALRKRKKTIFYTGAALFVTIAVITFYIFFSAAERITSIAVLPLENLTGDDKQEYFVDGITDELIGHLGQISGLKRVISRTSVMPYKNTDKSLPEIARELNVDAVVEGSVQHVGEKIRLRVNLIDALPEEQNLWGQTYEQDMTDVLVIYSEVARAVVNKIQINLTPEEETRLNITRKINPEAYDAYLLAVYFSDKMQFPKSIEYCEKAIRIDSNYAEAHSFLAMTYSALAEFGYPVEETASQAREAALRALTVDSTLADAYSARGGVKFHFDGDWSGAEADFKRAIELNPNSYDANDFYGLYLLLLGRFDEAISAKLRARELAPTTVVSNFALAYGYYCARRYDEAIAQCEKTLELNPNHGPTRFYMAYSYSKKGMHAEALALSQDLKLEKQPAYAAMLYANAGQREKALELIEGMIDYSYFRALASVYTILGEKEKAFEWLEKGYQNRDHDIDILWLKAEPFLDPLHDDPRYQDLLHRIGLSEL